MRNINMVKNGPNNELCQKKNSYTHYLCYKLFSQYKVVKLFCNHNNDFTEHSMSGVFTFELKIKNRFLVSRTRVQC